MHPQTGEKINIQWSPFGDECDEEEDLLVEEATLDSQLSVANWSRTLLVELSQC